MHSRSMCYITHNAADRLTDDESPTMQNPSSMVKMSGRLKLYYDHTCVNCSDPKQKDDDARY